MIGAEIYQSSKLRQDEQNLQDVLVSECLFLGELVFEQGFHAKHSMSDKLQFVDAPIESGFAGNDKLKFIGHRVCVFA
jgi:hypothetical protein